MTTTTAPSQTLPWVRLLRPRQWAKNVLVFAAPLGAGMVFEGSTLAYTLLAFVAFSMAASSMYALNDVMDVERDRIHPVKRNRPIAAGDISTTAGLVACALLAAAAIALSAWVSMGLVAVIVVYMLVTIGYSVRLKHVPVVELVIVASGFVLRAIAGGVAADVPISSWFLIVTSFGALFVVAGKRYAEFNSLDTEALSHRPTLGVYSLEYLRHVLTFSAGLAAMAYCLWAFEVPENGTGEFLMHLSIVPFVTALLRYGHIVMQGGGGEPEEVFLKDRELIVLGGIWLAIFGVGVTIG